VIGNFENHVSGMMMSHGPDGNPSNLYVRDDFKNSGGMMYFTLNSRDLSDPNAFTQIGSGRGVSLSGGTACVCISPDIVFQKNDKFDLVTATSLLEGKFSNVLFDCASCPTRNKRDVESSGGCQPTTSYSSLSFSVLFEACGSGTGGNFLTSITPPYYVIVPVAVGIIFILIVVFGGALLIDERVRRYRIKNRAKGKRANRIKELQEVEKSFLSRDSTSSATLPLSS